MDENKLAATEKEHFFQKKNILDLARFILIILLVLGLGLLAVNQGLGYLYKSRFLQSPCSLCKELNPQTQPLYIQQPSIQNITLNLT